MVARSIVTKVTRKENPVTALAEYIKVYYLLGLWLYSALWGGFNSLHFIVYEDRRISVDMLGPFNKFVDQYNKFKAGWKCNL